MAVKGQRDAKNAALIPMLEPLWILSFGDLYRGSTSLELYRGSSLLGFLHIG
ncbi:hypothetical protein BHE74_00023727 [Ensete ventricosum]|nr:hypothetical protein BHE74_00023727 [Ensete ventricosum]